MSKQFPSLEATATWTADDWAAAAQACPRIKDTHPLLGDPLSPGVRKAQASWMVALSNHPARANEFLLRSRRLAWPVLLSAVLDHGGAALVHQVLAPRRGSLGLEQDFQQAWSDMAKYPWPGMDAYLDSFLLTWQAVLPTVQLKVSSLLSSAFIYAETREKVTADSDRGQLIAWLWPRMNWIGQETTETSSWLSYLYNRVEPTWSERLRSNIPPEVQLPVMLGDALRQRPEETWVPVMEEVAAALSKKRVLPNFLGSVLSSLGVASSGRAMSTMELRAVACLLTHLGRWMPRNQLLEAYRSAARHGHAAATALLAPHVNFASPQLLPAADRKRWLSDESREGLDLLLEHAPTNIQMAWLHLLPLSSSALAKTSSTSEWPEEDWARLRMPRTQARLLATDRAARSHDHAPSRRATRTRV